MINLLPLPVLGTLSFVMILKYCGIKTKLAITLKYLAAALSVFFTSSFLIGWLSPEVINVFHWKTASDWAPLVYIAILTVVDMFIFKSSIKVLKWNSNRKTEKGIN